MPTFKIPTAISFSGCGFIGVYHIGLVRCLQIYGKQVIPHITKYGGASAGSLAAAVFAICPHKVLECKKLVYDLGEQVRKTRFGALNTGFNLSEHVEKLVDSVLPADAHELANDRVFISVTRKSCGKNFIISRYESRSELIQCLVSSSHIPFYSGSKYPIFRGEKYYDGGFTDNLIDFKKEETIYVTPFAGGQTYICPDDPITSFNYTVKNQNFCLNINNLARGFDALRPPSSKALETYYEQGFVDGLRYLAKLSKDGIRN
ncbi:patatin-like phospholipase domain-containing protein 4 isoform X2 [Watersipora subatra]|uniref:patatin-like phospholipase domain-containing protein 4 isoform X2 n=1 Tax=Watersipora subatra TaxID=2589382 RepID=UPI00355BFF47